MPSPAPAHEEGPAQKKGKVPLAEILNIMWKSEGKPEDCEWTWIHLSKPADGEECPITQEPISSSSLEFLPGVSFRKEDPEYSRIQLECGHSFSAMAITYQFFKNGMMCPLCRKGHSKTLAALCLPTHFRRAFQERLVIERAKVSTCKTNLFDMFDTCNLQDRVEADRENLAVAMLAAAETYANFTETLVDRNNWPEMTEVHTHDLRIVRIMLAAPDAMQGEQLGVHYLQTMGLREHSLSVFLRNHRMCIVAYAYDADDDIAPSAVMELPADAWSLPPHARLASPVASPAVPFDILASDPTRLQRAEGAGPDPTRNTLVISVARSALRELGRNLRNLQQPVRYTFVVATRSLTGSVVEMSRSRMVDLTAPEPVRGAFGGVYVESQSGEGGFDVR